MAYDIGPKIGIEGEAEFRRSIRQINDAYKTMRTEMETVTSAFEKNDKSQEALTEQNKVLNKQIDLQKQKLKEVTSVLEKCKSEYGETDSKTLAWQRTVNKTETELNKLESQLESNNRALQTNKNKWEEAAKGIDNFSEKAGKIGDKMAGVGGKMTAGITLPVIGAGVAATKMASDYEEALNKTDVAFGDSSQRVKDFADTTLDNFGIARGSTLDMAALFGDMATSMGLTTDAAADMGIELVGRAGDLASFKNIGLEQAQTALAGIFTGETESLKTLGVVMTETNLDAYALANGFGKTTKEMTEAEKVNLRFQYVMNATRNAAGDFARTSDGTANSARIFQESLKELGETFGEELLPVVTPMIQEGTKLIKSFGALDSQTKRTIITIAGFAAASGPVLTGVGKMTQGVSGLAKILGSEGLLGKLKGAEGGVTKLNSGVKGLIPSLGKASSSAGVLSGTVSGVGFGAVALAAAIPAVLTGLGMWYQHSINVRDGSQAIIDKTQELMSKNDELSANLAANAEQRQTNLQNIENERVSTEGLVSQLYSLVASYGETGNAQTVLQPIIDELNGRIEGLNLSWDNETQSLSLNREEIQKNIEKRAEQIKQQELMDQSVQIYQDLQTAEQQYNDAVAQGQSIHDQQNKILEDAVKKYEKLKDGQEKSRLILDYYRVHTEALNGTQQKNNDLINESAGKVDSLRGEYEQTLSVMTGEPVRAFERTQQDMFTAGADGLQKYMDGAMGKVPEFNRQSEQISKDGATSANSDAAKQEWHNTGWNLGEIFRTGLSSTGGMFNQTAREVAQGGSDSAKSKDGEYRNTGGLLGRVLGEGLRGWKPDMNAAGEEIAGEGRAGYNKGINNSADSEEASGNFVTRMLDKIKNAFGIHSPSTEMEWVGSMAGEGFINGLLESDIGQIAMGIAGNVLEAFDSGNLSLNSFLEALGGGMNGINAFIDFARSNLGEGMSGILDRLAGSFFTGAGNSAVAMTGGLLWPSDYSEITSWFGARPASDTNGIGSTNHGGLDIGAPYGAPIYSAGAGTVTLADWYGGYGNAVMIALDNGFTTLFGHMSSIGVSAGDRVAPGQIVGLVGSTGNSTGTHLHYSIFLNGQPIDPAQFYGFDVGSRKIPFDMPAMVHKDEMIVPARENPYVNSGGSILGGLFDGLDQRIAAAVAQALGGSGERKVEINQVFTDANPSPSEIERKTLNAMRKAALLGL